MPGNHTIIATHTGTPVENTYGCILAASTAPLAWGYQVAYSDVSEGLDARLYIPWYAQMVAVHRLFDGSPIFSQIAYVQQTIQLLRWEVALPKTIGLYIQPGWEVDLYWLRFL